MGQTVTRDAGRRVRTVRFRTLVLAVWLVVVLVRLSVYSWKVSESPQQVGRSGGTPTAPAENG